MKIAGTEIGILLGYYVEVRDLPDLDTSLSLSGDRVIRAMTNDGQFRVIAVTMVDTCREAAKRQSVSHELLARQAELMCAAVLVRETMQPGNRVQITLRDPAGHRLVADALPDGKNRSIINPGDPGQGEVNSKNGLLQVNYTLRSGDLHQGIVALDGDSTISAAIQNYITQSEQITAFVFIVAMTGPKNLDAVGGVVVQLTPETTPEGVREMSKAMEAFAGLQDWLCTDSPDPAELIAPLLNGHEYALLANSPLGFGCTCSVERMVLGLSTLPTADIGELIESGDIEVSCDACGESYVITTDLLAEAFIAKTQDPSAPTN